MEVLHTVEGKNTTYTVVRTPDGRRFFIKATEGALPKQLSGEYTRASLALHALTTYLEVTVKLEEWKEKVRDTGDKMDPKLKEQLEKRKAEKASKAAEEPTTKAE